MKCTIPPLSKDYGEHDTGHNNPSGICLVCGRFPIASRQSELIRPLLGENVARTELRRLIAEDIEADFDRPLFSDEY